MAKLSEEEIEHISVLARIEIGKDKLAQKTDEVSSILEFASELQGIDTKGVLATAQVTGLQDVWREDVVKNCDIPREELLQNAPQTQDGYIKVKKVL